MNKPKDKAQVKALTDEMNDHISKGSFDGVVDFLLDRSAAERAELAKPAMARLRSTAAGEDGKYKPEVWNAARLAVLGTNSFSKFARLRWGDERFSRWTEWRLQMYRLVSKLQPDWLDDCAEAILKQNITNWAFVRRLIREGYCRKPACDEYTLGMMYEMRWRFSSDVFDGKGNGKKGLANVQAALLDDADLLKDDLWKIFEIEGNSDCNLQSLEPVGYTALAPKFNSISDPAIYSWRYALVDMAKHGHIPRARLLESSLAALARGFTPHRAGWFVRLYEELQPTFQERQSHLQSYLQLLGSPNPNTITFALDALVALDKEKPVAGKDVLQSIEPALALKAKATVKLALQWLDRIARREPKLGASVARRATSALYHEAPDVQAAAFKLIETYGDQNDAELRDSLEQCQKAIAATLN